MPATALPRDAPCPCGSGAPYTRCCAPFVESGAPAPTAEALMRSRYTAYVLERHDHVLATWHASTRPASIEPSPPGQRWLGLEVRRIATIDADNAEVEFVARIKLGGRAQRMHETSRFVREGGRWYYLIGRLMA